MEQSKITERSLENHIAVMGTTGGGKSYSARKIIEDQLTAKRRVCIIDSEGIWWGLKANAAGDGPGFPVAVIGGDHGDMPLTEGMSEAWAERDGDWHWTPFPKDVQVSCCGNSVCPDLARALVAANCQHLIQERIAA